MKASLVAGEYEKAVDRESAYESLNGRADSLIEATSKRAARTIGSSVVRQIVRGVLGSLQGGSSKR